MAVTIPELKQDISFQATLRGQPLTFHSTWGLFSPKAIDEGTVLLLNHIEIAPNAHVLDLGCGYGPLGLTLAKLAPQGQIHLVDKDFVAIEFTAKNAQLNHLSNTQAYLSNGFAHVPPSEKFDLIVSNIPAKIGTELLQIFLHDAHAHLNPGGRLYLVTVSGLKEYMKRHLTAVFGNYSKLKQSKTYTAAMAVKTDAGDMA
ncbi:MAG TPA: methyltransferase [Candidatus Saccharimonadia bacterium]|nr:methyltransferase [Candidatus Saccharimonadia bacterium]